MTGAISKCQLHDEADEVSSIVPEPWRLLQQFVQEFVTQKNDIHSTMRRCCSLSLHFPIV